MTKVKRTFKAETVTVSALRLEDQAPRTHKPARKNRRSPDQKGTIITVELIHKITDRIKDL